MLELKLTSFFTIVPPLAPLGLVFLMSSFLGIVACAAPEKQCISDAASTTSPTGTTNIRFLHFNDLHAHLLPHLDRVADGLGGTRVEKRGGLAYLKTLVDEARSEVQHSVFMNIGDTYHGGVEALFSNGNAIAPVVNALGIDVGVPGNWDFGYGPGVTRGRFQKDQSHPSRLSVSEVTPALYCNLAANVWNGDGTNAEDTFLPPTLLKRFGDVDVGFIGLSSDFVPEMSSLMATSFTFLLDRKKTVALVQQHAADLRKAGADVVVVMSELSVHKDVALANELLPGEVDVVFSAHTHELTREPLRSNSGVWVVESGNDTWLGVMDLTVTEGVLTNVQWNLREVSAKTATENSAIRALIKEARAPFLEKNVNMLIPLPNMTQRLTQPIDSVIGHVAFPLERKSMLENSFNRMLTYQKRKHGKTDVGLTPGLRYGDSIDAQNEIDGVIAGEVTLEQLYTFVPVPYQIATGNIPAGVLRKNIETNLSRTFSPDLFSQRGGWVDGYNGLKIKLDLHAADGDRILSFKLAGEDDELSDARMLSVTGCYSPAQNAPSELCRKSGFGDVTPLQKENIPLTALDIAIEAIREGAEEQPAVFEDVSGEMFWPASDFIQPIPPNAF